MEAITPANGKAFSSGLNAKRTGGTEMEENLKLSSAQDTLLLARLGKRQVLKRNFGFLTMVAFSCTILVTWEGVFTSVPNYENGGSAGLIYGYLVVWAGTLSTFVSIAELASIAPTSGGQYHWVAMLSPPSCRKFLSYIIGWMTIVAWQAAIASGAFLVGTIVQGLLVLNSPTYIFRTWHGTLLIWACIFVAVFVNTYLSGMLPFIEGGLLLVHILGFIIIFIIMVYMAPHGNIHDVFTQFVNEGNWPTQGLSTMVGLIGLVFAFVGADAAVHMSEEIQNANINVPKSIFASMLLNGLMGFIILLATMFGLGDIDAALASPTKYPFIEIFASVTGSEAGGTGLTVIILIMMFAATIGFTATSSRMIWAFARDKGLPFSPFLSKVHPRTSVPQNAVAVTTVIACILSLINLGSTVILENIFSLSIAGFYSTYFASVSLLLWRRCTGSIRDRAESDDQSTTAIDIRSGELVWGPWRVKGWLGVAINSFACVYLVVIMFFSFWPPVTPVTPATMNFSVAIVGIILIFSISYYFAWGKKQYNGPIVEIIL